MISVPFAHVGGIPIEDSRVLRSCTSRGVWAGMGEASRPPAPGAHSRRRARPRASAQDGRSCRRRRTSSGPSFRTLCEVRGGSTRLEPGVNSSLATGHPEAQRSQDPEALLLAQVDAVRGPIGSLDPRPRREVVVVRIFRARVHPGKEDEFERFVIETGVPMVKAQEGCTHVTVGKSRWSEQPEFVVVTHLEVCRCPAGVRGAGLAERGDRARGGAHAGPGLLRSLRNDRHGLSRQRMAA